MIEIAPGVPPVPYWLPPAASFLLALFLSPAGVSGAFLLLPFQVSILGFTSPAVTPTNHLFNVLAIPGAVYRYVREKRMLWPLSLLILLGSVPGAILGVLVRVRLLHDVARFKILIAFVLLFIGFNLIRRIGQRRRKDPKPDEPGSWPAVEVRRFDGHRLEYAFGHRVYGISTWRLSMLSLLVGVIGGAYGTGGGAFVSPVLVSTFDLPVHSIAGAALFSTWATSLVAALLFSLLGPLLAGPNSQAVVAPNWTLGLLFGLGGMLGTYMGARLQRFLPARIIEATLLVVVTGLAISYLIGFFRD